MKCIQSYILNFCNPRKYLEINLNKRESNHLNHKANTSLHFMGAKDIYLLIFRKEEEDEGAGGWGVGHGCGGGLWVWGGWCASTLCRRGSSRDGTLCPTLCVTLTRLHRTNTSQVCFLWWAHRPPPSLPHPSSRFCFVFLVFVVHMDSEGGRTKLDCLSWTWLVD